MSKYRHWWRENVVRSIREYPNLRERKNAARRYATRSVTMREGREREKRMSGNKSCPAYSFCPDAIKINCMGCGFENIDFFGDIANVVLCKDCKHFNGFNEQCEKSSFYGRTMGEDGYCSYGERKDNE